MFSHPLDMRHPRAAPTTNKTRSTNLSVIRPAIFAPLWSQSTTRFPAGYSQPDRHRLFHSVTPGMVVECAGGVKGERGQPTVSGTFSGNATLLSGMRKEANREIGVPRDGVYRLAGFQQNWRISYGFDPSRSRLRACSLDTGVSVLLEARNAPNAPRFPLADRPRTAPWRTQGTMPPESAAQCAAPQLRLGQNCT